MHLMILPQRLVESQHEQYVIYHIICLIFFAFLPQKHLSSVAVPKTTDATDGNNGCRSGKWRLQMQQ